MLFLRLFLLRIFFLIVSGFLFGFLLLFGLLLLRLFLLGRSFFCRGFLLLSGSLRLLIFHRRCFLFGVLLSRHNWPPFCPIRAIGYRKRALPKQDS